MGADQSSGLKSQRDEDIPHTSYSIGKPISGGYVILHNDKMLIDELSERAYAQPISHHSSEKLPSTLT